MLLLLSNSNGRRHGHSHSSNGLYQSRLGFPTSWHRRLTLLTIITCCCLFSQHTAVVDASKDDSYYAANSGNPNTNLKMYWKDAENVLQDLSQFQSLYVQFHSCVWSWMHPTSSGYDDEDIDENDYWYMGSVPPMGPNVAYSLYGSLKGNNGFEGCNSNTFINSFYTDAGFEDFAAAMYAAGVSGFSAYASGGGSSSSSSSSTYGSSCYGGYGVGCDKTNGFALHTYASNECDPKYATAVTDKLSSLNSAMNQASCVKIYDRSSSSSSSYSSSSSSYSSRNPLALLQYSTACNYMNYWSPDGECPDPYNKIAYYINNFSTGIKSHHPDPYQWYYADMAAGRTMMHKGLVFMGLAALVIVLGWTSHLWMPKFPTVKLPKMPKLPKLPKPKKQQQQPRPPVKKIDTTSLALPSGTDDEVDTGCVAATRWWFSFSSDTATVENMSNNNNNNNNTDDRRTVKSFDSAASPPRKKKKTKKRKRKHAASDAASVKSADDNSAYQLHQEDDATAPADDDDDDNESVPASFSWFSFGSATDKKDNKKKKMPPQDAPGDVLTSTSWFSFPSSGKKDAASSPTAEKETSTKNEGTYATAAVQKQVSKHETAATIKEETIPPAVENKAEITTPKEEDQVKDDVPAIRSWLSFTSTSKKEETPDKDTPPPSAAAEKDAAITTPKEEDLARDDVPAATSWLSDLLDPKPDPTWHEGKIPKTDDDVHGDKSMTDNNEQDDVVPAATSWFSFTSSSKKKKMVEEGFPKEDGVDKTKIDHKPNQSVPPPEDSAIPAAKSWFSFLSSNKNDDNDNDKTEAAHDNADRYVLHEEVEHVPSPKDGKAATDEGQVDKRETADVYTPLEETSDAHEPVDDSHYALLTAVSSLTCDQTTVAHLEEDTAPKAVVEEKVVPKTTPLGEALNAVPESAAETTSTPSQEGSESDPDTKVMDNMNVAEETVKEHVPVTEEHSMPEPLLKVEKTHAGTKDAGTSICHEDAQVEAVLSGDGSDIQSVTPSELVATLSRQQEALKEASEGDSNHSAAAEAAAEEAGELVNRDVLSDLRSVGTTHSLTPEEMAARVLAVRSRQDDESTTGGAFSDVLSVGTARSLTPEEMAARIRQKRAAKEEEEG